MLTSTAARENTRSEPRKPKPSFRLFDVSVARMTKLSATFMRVTFTGEDLHEFGTVGLDQRVKVVLPLPGIGISELPDGQDWYIAWRNLPEEARNPIRTYTVRAVRQAEREIDIDFVLHGDAGPASRWVSSAAVGDKLMIVGPDALGEDPRSGVEWRPGDADTFLIAGDETAAPAICSILASLPRNATGCAFIEVPEPSDFLETDSPEGVQVTWLARSESKVQDAAVHAGIGHGSGLAPAVRDWTSRYLSAPAAGPELVDVDIDAGLLWEVPTENTTPSGNGLYAWLAGEASVIKSLRRFLVTESGIDRKQVAFMGYWRQGRSELN